jgi:hypothetical protein
VQIVVRACTPSTFSVVVHPAGRESVTPHAYAGGVPLKTEHASAPGARFVPIDEAEEGAGQHRGRVTSIAS